MSVDLPRVNDVQLNTWKTWLSVSSRNTHSVGFASEWYLSDKIFIQSKCLTFMLIFTALHGMQTRSSDGNSVCLSVCLSVCPSVRLSVRLSVRQTRGLWQNGRKLYLDFYIIRKNIYPSFLRRRIIGGGRPLLPEILGQPARVGAKSPILNR